MDSKPSICLHRSAYSLAPEVLHGVRHACNAILTNAKPYN